MQLTSYAVLVVMCAFAVNAAGDINAKFPMYRAGGTNVQGFTGTNCPSWMTYVDRTSSYTNTFTGIKGMCKFGYEEVCATPDGVYSCNLHVARCVDLSSREWNKGITRTWWSGISMNSKPQHCTETGLQAGDARMMPDTAVIAAAQPACAFIVFLLALILSLIPAISKNENPHYIGFVICAILTWMSACIILFSYFYLDAFITCMVICIGIGCFATRCPIANAAGMLALFAALLWFTFSSGLGAIQHHHRFSGANAAPSDMMYETMCVEYYKGYFRYEFWTEDDKANPMSTGMSYCSWGIVAAMFWFMTFIKILITIMMFVGAIIMHYNIWGVPPKAQTLEAY